MANKSNKNAKNVGGAWYVTAADDGGGEGCIACNVCTGSAPDLFAEDANGNAYVQKQPSTDEEKAQCQEQLEACPASAIGNDA